jgi:hypothetical protein
MIPATRFFQKDGSVSAKDEEILFRNIRNANGTYKQTERHRLDLINKKFFEVISNAGHTINTAIDIGISSGITTLEWAEEFRARGMSVKIYAVDVTLHGYLADIGAGLKVLLDRTGHVMQVEGLGVGIRSYHRRRDLLWAAPLWRVPLLQLVRARLYSLGLAGPWHGVPDHPRLRGPYPLVTPMLRTLSNVTILEDDIMSPRLTERADVIRLANVVLPPDQMHAAVRNVKRLCRGMGSIIIACRNFDGRLNGSIFRLDQNNFIVVARVGHGSDLEDYFIRNVKDSVQ